MPKRVTRKSFHYYFVLDGDSLKPIEKFAIKREYDNLYEYFIVDDSKLRGKPIIELSFIGSGYLSAREYTIDDFTENGDPDYSKGKEVNVLDFCDKFDLSREDEREYKEFKTTYIPMIREIKDYTDKMNIEIIFAGYQKKIIKETIEYDCPIGCLVQHGRFSGCFNSVKGLIYQLWVLKLIFEAINVTQFVHFVSIIDNKIDNKPYIRLEQGKPVPAAQVLTPYDGATFWYEFQLYENLMRPDIIFVRGIINQFDDPQKLLNYIYNRSIIIECKAGNYDNWKREVREQIRYYRQIYKPKYLVLTSLKPSPRIRDADETFSPLQPGSKEVERFKEYIRDVFIRL